MSTDPLPPFQTRELPEPPTRVWPLIGPGIIAAGVGLASGEFILWPFIASQVGLMLLWGAAIGIATQWFLNMEIERYTLATGETALAGFTRLWKHWGLVFAVLVYFANLWPGWATSSATMLTYLVGGDATVIAIGLLLVIGAALTLAPVVYTLMERVQFLKVVAVVTFIIVAVIFVITREAWAELPRGFTQVGTLPPQLGFALVMGAFAYAGAGGGQNLCQSNWIRDKGFGMGAYVPRLVSPITGEEGAAHVPGGYRFEPTAANLARWRGWWRMANLEQALTFALISFVTIVFTSMIAYSTVYGRPGVPQNVDFIRTQGEQMQLVAGAWFGVLYWIIGAVSLFAAAMGIVDYTSRIGADVLKSTYLRGSRHSENRIYFALVWALVLCGCIVLLFGVRQPLVLLVISSVTSGVTMCIYSVLLILLNRRWLPAQIRISRPRTAALVWSTLLFGFLAVLTFQQQIRNLLS
ncbi:MAG TPA: Nramp family divalent metal transporter [Povalibacter sp.]|uniref:Nramp family divalent metal transporter n=1 Tax=Povalibacter sp. TaxID=1962978 RepID=UPI002C69C293|nr:Nramp family divalent metal transporter [Povalibacter sp.]HMN45030.1 Nramp family divalent metal transporter [Povalibacter sp.]